MIRLRVLVALGALMAGGTATLAAQTEVLAWGQNNAGQCNLPPAPAGAHWVSIAAADESTLLLASDGSVRGVGWCGAGQGSATSD